MFSKLRALFYCLIRKNYVIMSSNQPYHHLTLCMRDKHGLMISGVHDSTIYARDWEFYKDDDGYDRARMRKNSLLSGTFVYPDKPHNAGFVVGEMRKGNEKGK